MSASNESSPSIPVTTLATTSTGALDRTEPDERDGIGALQTERGNLPLESLDIAVATSGLAVRTELTQGFCNPYAEPLEATYIFPLPARSAVISMVMRADDRTVEGELKERGQARQDYDQALGQGKRASIAEEERPGVFTMRVGNVLPGEAVSVTLTLAGTLPYEDGEATVRFPLVVAPRYIPGEPAGGRDVGSGVQPDTDAVPDASRITPPVLLPGFPNPIRLSISADIDPAGLPIEQAIASMHPVRTEQRDGRLQVRVHPGERADRDFVLRLLIGEPDAISSALTLVPDPDHGPDECGQDDQDASTGTFSLTLLPPRRATRPAPRDVVFVLDRSGSMRGWKMVAARRATARILDTLTSQDRFAVLTFDNTVETPIGLPDGLVAASDRDRFRAIEHLANTDARGGTEMLTPLLRATELLNGATYSAEGHQHSQSERERVLVLVTDGQVGNEDQILSELSDRFADLRMHTVGIDRAVNDAFLGRLAMLGGGRSELVESEDRLDVAMDAIHRRIGIPVLTDLELDPENLDVDSESIAPAVLPALYAGSALTVHGRYRDQGNGGDDKDARAAIRVTGRTGGEPRTEKLTATAGDHLAMAAVWARARLRDLEDRYVSMRGADRSRLESLERQITEISLRYRVLCRFTAYVAVDSYVVTKGGTPRQVTQPVDLPQGWELPPEATPGAPLTRATTASASLGVGATSEAARARAARPLRADTESAAQRPASGPASGVGNGGVSGGVRRRRSGSWTAPAVDPAASAEANRLLAQMRAVEPQDRAQWLARTLPSLEQLAESLAGTPDAAAVRILCGELRTHVIGAKPDPYGTERIWLRVSDVLGALAGSSNISVDDRGATSDTAQRGGDRGPARSEREFWRRSPES